MRSALALTAILMLGAGGGSPGARGEPLKESAEVPAADRSDAVSAASTYYSAHRDLRRCMAPLCGGWWVRRVNRSTTRCPDGKNRSECYVFEVDAPGLGLGENELDKVAADAGSYLFRGSLAQSTRNKLVVGVLQASEVWRNPSSGTEAGGTIYRVDPNRIRCITFPCPATYQEAKLNSGMSTTLSGFIGPIALEIGAELQGADSVLAAGTNKMVGGNRVLEVTRFWLRGKPPAKTIQRPPGR